MNSKGHEANQDKSCRPALTPDEEAVIRQVIGAGLAVHRQLGPGFLEPVYGRALCVELQYRGLIYEQEKVVAIRYRDLVVSQHRLDLVIAGIVVVEVKAVKRLRPIHQAQLLSYLKASGHRVGLLMNFNVRLFVDGLQRFVR